MYFPNPMLSFERIHETNNSATPASILYCKLAIQHFRIFDSNESLFEWCLLKSQLSTNIKTVLFYYWLSRGGICVANFKHFFFNVGPIRSSFLPVEHRSFNEVFKLFIMTCKESWRLYLEAGSLETKKRRDSNPGSPVLQSAALPQSYCASVFVLKLRIWPETLSK